MNSTVSIATTEEIVGTKNIFYETLVNDANMQSSSLVIQNLSFDIQRSIDILLKILIEY